MSDEQKKRIEELEIELNKLKNMDKKVSFSFSKITKNELKQLVDIKLNIEDTIFDKWFNNSIKIENDLVIFLQNLIDKEKKYLRFYSEEDLKVNFLVPILNKIDFKINTNLRSFYNEKLTYETDKFIFNGETDFVVAQGLENAEKPYFFIQEFKKRDRNGYPEPQLLAELISSVELNNEIYMKGAYIVGEIWNFVILEKLENNKYQYFVSDNFDSSKIDDLKKIYRNLLFVKNEIIEIIQE
jgi:hypothetical protein